MATCKDCEHYEPKNETQGNCFGYEVLADTDINECPAKAFKPKQAE